MASIVEEALKSENEERKAGMVNRAQGIIRTITEKRHRRETLAEEILEFHGQRAERQANGLAV